MRLDQFEMRAYQAYLEAEKRIWGEIDGQQVLLYQSQLSEMSKLREEAHQLQSMIEQERATQEKVMQDLRNALLDTNSA